MTRVRKEIVRDSDLAGGKRLGDDGAAIDAPRAGWVPERTSVCENILYHASQTAVHDRVSPSIFEIRSLRL